MKHTKPICDLNKEILLLEALLSIVNHSDLCGQYSIELFTLMPRLVYVSL